MVVAEAVVCAAHSVTRAGLSAMVAMPTTEVVGQVSSLDALSDWVQTQHVDLAVVLTDEIEETFQFVESLPSDSELFVLVLLERDMIEIDAIEQQALARLMGTGFVSMLPVTVSGNGLRSAIASILSGFNILYPNITEALFAPTNSILSPVDADELEPLTPREIQVLNQLASGVTNRAIAKALNISEHTVKFHISAILSKLEVSSRTEAVAVGIRNGLVML